MNTNRMHLPLLATLLFGSMLCPAAFASDGVDCVSAAWRLRNPQELQTTVQVLKITLNNHCAKDVTAVAVVLRDPNDDSRTERTAVDWLVYLTYPYRSQADSARSGDSDILRHGTSNGFDASLQPQFSDPSIVTVSVTGVLFADGTSVGAPASIESVRQTRAQEISELQERYDALVRLSDYDRAREIARGGGLSVSANVKPRIEELMRTLEQSDSASWAKFVAREKQVLLDRISVFQHHVGLMKEQLESK